MKHYPKINHFFHILYQSTINGKITTNPGLEPQLLEHQTAQETDKFCQ